MEQITSFEKLVEHVKKIRVKTVVVAAAHNDAALSAIIEAKKLNIANGLLIGDAQKIKGIFKELNFDKFDEFEIIDEKDEKKCALKSVQIIQENKADILLKGKIDTSTLMKVVLAQESNLRTGKLLCVVSVLDNLLRKDNKLMIMSDGGLVLTPDLNQKIEIIKNCVEVAHSMGNLNPKVAILSASEIVNPNMQSTVDAAIISKMNERGQIKGCIIDGPLALDNAISPEAAAEKGIKSPVAGFADILIVNNIETGNIFAKSLIYFANYRLANVVIGAKIPILITSRADSAENKLLAVCMGSLMSN
jgi:phosphate butyryltransferase